LEKNSSCFEEQYSQNRFRVLSNLSAVQIDLMHTEKKLDETEPMRKEEVHDEAAPVFELRWKLRGGISVL